MAPLISLILSIVRDVGAYLYSLGAVYNFANCYTDDAVAHWHYW